MPKVYIVGAGPGDPELLTLKAYNILRKAGVVIYAGSLVNPEILKYANPSAEIYNSAEMDINKIMDIIDNSIAEGKDVVRLHSGDPHLYGALMEQLSLLREKGIDFEVIPGVSVLTSAAASLGIELTMDNISQSVIIARGSLRIPVPEKQSILALSSHQSTMVIFTAIHIIEKVVEDLLKGGYPKDTPVGVVYHSTWKDEKVIRGTLEDIVQKVKDNRIYRTAIIVVGKVVNPERVYSTKLYDPSYTHSFRRGSS